MPVSAIERIMKKYNDRLEGHDIKSFIPELGSDIKKSYSRTVKDKGKQ